METWIIFALLSAIAAWLHNFMFKMVAERNYDPNLINAYGYIIGVVVMSFYFILFPQNFTRDDYLIVWALAFCNSLFFNLSIISRVQSMKNIDTVIFFPLYKTVWPILVTLLSLFFFWENLTEKEFLWIILWICVPLMLITHTENKIQKNLYYWIILMLVTVVLSTISASSAKMVEFVGRSLDLFIFLTFVFGMTMSFMSYFLQSTKKRVSYKKENIFKFCFLIGIFHISSFIFFSKALAWNFAIAFTINSFSILIPIILSIIFYGEHFNFKKGIVIALSIVSILLFI